MYALKRRQTHTHKKKKRKRKKARLTSQPFGTLMLTKKTLTQMKKQVNLVAKYHKTNLAVRLLSSPKRLKRSIVNDTKNIGS